MFWGDCKLPPKQTQEAPPAAVTHRNAGGHRFCSRESGLSGTEVQGCGDDELQPPCSGGSHLLPSGSANEQN